MGVGVELATLVDRPLELLREMENRARTAVLGEPGDSILAEWTGIAFRIDTEGFVANSEQVREVLPLPDNITRVPGVKRWLIGIANLHGHLVPLIDLKMFLGGGRTSIQKNTRIISINHYDMPAGIVIDEVCGFRRFLESEYIELAPENSIRCENYLRGAYDRDNNIWSVFDFYGLLKSSGFLKAATD